MHFGGFTQATSRNDSTAKSCLWPINLHILAGSLFGSEWRYMHREAQTPKGADRDMNHGKWKSKEKQLIRKEFL